MERPPRVLFFGMQGNFSFPSLSALVGSGVEVCAVIVPASPALPTENAVFRQIEKPRAAYAPRTTVPMLKTTFVPSLTELAWAHNIPLWEVTRLSHPETVTMLADYSPDMICVACFSQRIPRSILDIPCLGCLNVHPSLLPAHRGPVPLFWTFREGSKQTGVTIHLMNEALDNGDILAQARVPVPVGIRYAELESHCAELGGTLLSQVVWELFSGVARRQPQSEGQSSYQSFPGEEDFALTLAAWEAEHAYSFICGVGVWGEPIKLYSGTRVFYTRQAISYSQESTGEKRKESDFYFAEGNVLWLRCKSGWVSVLPLSM